MIYLGAEAGPTYRRTKASVCVFRTLLRPGSSNLCLDQLNSELNRLRAEKQGESRRPQPLQKWNSMSTVGGDDVEMSEVEDILTPRAGTPEAGDGPNPVP